MPDWFILDIQAMIRIYLIGKQIVLYLLLYCIKAKIQAMNLPFTLLKASLIFFLLMSRSFVLSSSIVD